MKHQLHEFKHQLLL